LIPSSKNISLLLALFVGQSFVVYLELDHWPVSNYPMFARARHSHKISVYQTIGIDQDKNIVRPKMSAIRDPWGEYHQLLAENDFSKLEKRMKSEFTQRSLESCKELLLYKRLALKNEINEISFRKTLVFKVEL
jgi:hypothetical protein